MVVGKQLMVLDEFPMILPLLVYPSSLVNSLLILVLLSGGGQILSHVLHCVLIDALQESAALLILLSVLALVDELSGSRSNEILALLVYVHLLIRSLVYKLTLSIALA